MKKRLTNRMKIAGELRARDLNEKAWKFYTGTFPLDIYEDDTDPDNVVYHIRGYCEIDNMTFSELEDMFTESQEELEEEEAEDPDAFRRKSMWFYDGTGRETLLEADGIAVYVEDGYIHLVTDADDIETPDTDENRSAAIEDARRTIAAWKD